jgi:inhibitor of cysteine peptidase
MSGDILKLVEQDGGRKVPVQPGQVVEIALPENPTTGWRWTLPDAPGLELVDDTYAVPDQLVPGAATMRILRFRVLGGQIEVIMRRTQSWEPGSVPDALFEITLVPQ